MFGLNQRLILFLTFLVFAQDTDPSVQELKNQNLASIGLAKIYVINLERRTDKLKGIKSQLDYLILPFTRFNAIDGQIIKECFKEQMCWSFSLHPEVKFNPYEYGLDYWKNEWAFPHTGLWLSHLEIYFEIFESNNNSPVLILEDDVIMESNLGSIIQNALKMIPNDWDLLFLSHSGSRCIKKINNNLCRAVDILLASGYIVNGPKAAKKLIGLSNHLEFTAADYIWKNAIFPTNFGTSGKKKYKT